MRQLAAGASVPDRDNAAILAALNSVAASYNVDPAAIAAMINTESAWDSTCVSTIYIGLTQVGPDFVSSLKLTKQAFLDLTPAQQITIYGKWLASYSFLQQCAKYKMNVAGQSIARQWPRCCSRRSSSPRTARVGKPRMRLATTPFHRPTPNRPGFSAIHRFTTWKALCAGFFQQYPPTYADDQDAALLKAALPRTSPQVAMSLVSDTAFQSVAEALAPSVAGDQQQIADLIGIASDPAQLVAARAPQRESCCATIARSIPTMAAPSRCPFCCSKRVSASRILIARSISAIC